MSVPGMHDVNGFKIGTHKLGLLPLGFFRLSLAKSTATHTSGSFVIETILILIPHIILSLTYQELHTVRVLILPLVWYPMFTRTTLPIWSSVLDKQLQSTSQNMTPVRRSPCMGTGQCTFVWTTTCVQTMAQKTKVGTVVEEAELKAYHQILSQLFI